MAALLTPLTHDDPQQLGPYRLVARLGSGGMGTVYLARSAGGRTVALKTMHADIAGGEAGTEFRTRFRLETDAARVIGDRFGARVVDADPLAETPWLATEYVLGPPLDEAVAACGPLPEDATRALGAALCRALGQLHASGVVHRDLKPSNIMLTAAGPKVIDFGIARAAGDDRLTRTGTAAGTPAFMSPEQASGVEHTPVGDVFALAGVLVFACAGHGPFGGGQAADLLYRVRYGDADLSGVPAGLLPVLERCLDKDPGGRPGTEELAALLEEGSHTDGYTEFADRLPDAVHAEILRRATTAWQPPPPRLPSPDTAAAETRLGGAPGPSRRKVLALTGAGVVAAGAAAAGAWAYFRDEPAPEAKPKPKKPKAPQEVWQRKVAGGEGAFTLATADHYLVLLTSTGGGQFVDARSGRLRSTNDISLSPITGVAGDEKRFYSLSTASVSGQGTGVVNVQDPETGEEEKLVTLTGARLKGLVIEGVEGGKVLFRATTRWPRKERKKTVWTPWAQEFVVADLESGQALWGHPNDSPDIGPSYATALTEREVIIRVEHELTCLDPDTGAVRWTWSAPKADRELMGGLQQFPTTRTHVFLGLRDLVALRLSDGEVDWTLGEDRDARAELGPDTRLYGTPAVKDGTLYVVENGTGLLAVDAAGGEVEWEARADWAGQEAFILSPVVGEKYVYVSTGGRDWVRAVDLEERRTAWSFRGPEDNDRPMIIAQKRAKRLIVVTAADVRGLPLE